MRLAKAAPASVLNPGHTTVADTLIPGGTGPSGVALGAGRPGMCSWATGVEIPALRRQGWTVSAIACHAGVTRLTVCRYPDGKRMAGTRAHRAAVPTLRGALSDLKTARLSGTWVFATVCGPDCTRERRG